MKNNYVTILTHSNKNEGGKGHRRKRKGRQNVTYAWRRYDSKLNMRQLNQTFSAWPESCTAHFCHVILYKARTADTVGSFDTHLKFQNFQHSDISTCWSQQCSLLLSLEIKSRYQFTCFFFAITTHFKHYCLTFDNFQTPIATSLFLKTWIIRSNYNLSFHISQIHCN